jgi:hypothetical protein
MAKQFITEAARMQKLAGILKENEEIKKYNLIKIEPGFGDYLDTEMYEDILRKEAQLRRIKINESELDEFLEELGQGGFTGEEYRNITASEILEDYLSSIGDEDLKENYGDEDASKSLSNQSDRGNLSNDEWVDKLNRDAYLAKQKEKQGQALNDSFSDLEQAKEMAKKLSVKDPKTFYIIEKNKNNQTFFIIKQQRRHVRFPGVAVYKNGNKV